ncbi:MAG: molybdopterin converting factor subunit 1 [Paracoccaceae bacterium]
MQVLYFAWLKERVGTSSEHVTTSATTARALIAELIARSDGHVAAFSDLSAIRVAVNQQMVDLDASIEGAQEVAFFPPVTGG